MQEFLEKAKGFNEWHWQGSPWQYLLYVGILLVLLFSKRKMFRLILGYLPLVYLICIYNPLFMAGLELMGVGGNQYFARMFSFMPMMYAIAAGIVFLIGRIPKSWLKFIVVVAVCAGLIVSGRSIYDQNWFVRAQNFAKVPNDVYEVGDILENTGDKNVGVATFDPITNYMRQVSDVVTSYARSPGSIWYMLNADPPDVQAVMKAAGEQGMDFMTSRRTDTTIQAFHDAGYEPYALTEKLVIYEVAGVRKLVRTFNEKRQVVSVTVYDEEGNIEKDSRGFSTTAYTYDDSGYQNGVTYLDEQGQPMIISEGYAGERWERSARGLILSSKYVNVEGQPILISGRYEFRSEYDLKGRVIRESFYDEAGAPMNRTDTFYASREIKYNGEGLNVEEIFYDVRGNLTQCSEGYAKVRRTYDEKKRLISERYYDEQDTLKKINSGYAEFRRIYDENGNMLSEAYYDIEGQLVQISAGYAEVQRIYDGDGKQLSEAYYDTKGNLILLPAGYAVLIREYDEDGNNVLERYEDGIGQLILRDTGYAIVRRVYNSLHQIITEAFFDVEGNPVNNSSGYATLERIYDGLTIMEEIRKDVEGNVL